MMNIQGRNRLLICITIVIGVAAVSAADTQIASSQNPVADSYNVRAFGAKGDGKTLDTAAINQAIDVTAAADGGTVYFPAGNYLSTSIHLKSNIAIYLDQGATIIADETTARAKYDPPEPNPWDAYDDFGHTHWHNSLIWGENLENVSHQTAAPDAARPDDRNILEVLAPNQAVVPMCVTEIVVSVPCIRFGRIVLRSCSCFVGDDRGALIEINSDIALQVNRG